MVRRTHSSRRKYYLKDSRGIMVVKCNILTNFFIIKPTGCTTFTNLFCHENLRVSDSSSAHHQEFIHCTLSNVICHRGLWTAFEQEHMLLLESCLQTCMTCIIAECTVNKLLMIDRQTVRIM